VKSFVHAMHLDTGLRAEHVLTFEVALPRAKYASSPQVSGFYRDLLGRLSNSPGVEAAAAVSDLPMTGGMSSGAFRWKIAPRPPTGSIRWFNTASRHRAIFAPWEFPSFTAATSISRILNPRCPSAS